MNEFRSIFVSVILHQIVQKEIPNNDSTCNLTRINQ